MTNVSRHKLPSDDDLRVSRRAVAAREVIRRLTGRDVPHGIMTEAIQAALSVEPRLVLDDAGGTTSLLRTLTAREREVALLVAAGKTNKQVAQILVVVEPTVKYHLSNIYRKLGIASRTQLAAVVHRSGAEAQLTEVG